MKRLVLGWFIFLMVSGAVWASTKKIGAQGFYALLGKDIDGKPVEMSKYRGKVTLVVNTASRCGLTSQYEGLQKLHLKYHSKGFSVLAFPSNDFLGQEPGANIEIKLFCEKNYNVSFPLFSKDKVKGKEKQLIYKYLTEGPQSEFHGEISWNFEKFLIGKNGKILARFKPNIDPESVEVVSEVEKALALSE